MKHLLTASVIAIASATAASASSIFPGPGLVSLTDADVPGFVIDSTDLPAVGTAVWTFQNASSNGIVFSDILTSGLSVSSSSLETILVGFGVADTGFNMPFVNNGLTVEGSVAFPDFVLGVGNSIDLIFDASSITVPAAVDFAFAITAIPVPATLPLVAGGLGLLALFRRKT